MFNSTQRTNFTAFGHRTKLTDPPFADSNDVSMLFIGKTFQNALKLFFSWLWTKKKPKKTPFLFQLVEKLLSTEFADQTRAKINDTQTSNNASYYGGLYDASNDHGTSHVSIIAPNGDAIAVTSSVNF